MKSLFRILAALFLLATLAATGAYFYMNEERTELSEDIRKNLPGRFIETPLGVVHYEIAGPDTGKTVVLVHGFSVPAYIWEPTFSALADSGFSVVSFDLFGRGYSDRPDTEYTIEFFSQQLAALLKALHIEEPVYLAGLSMGGPIVATFTNRHPEMVAKLVLVDPMVFPPTEKEIWPLQVPLVGEYLAAVHFLPRLADSQQNDFYDKTKAKNWRAKFQDQMQYVGFRRAILSTVRNFIGLDALKEYRELGMRKLPVQLFWGREDETLPIATSDTLRKVMPQVQFHIVDKAGHIPQYERPEVFNPLLVAFLRQETE
ncbi:MAG: alpha/beta hydrolase [Calditrichaeota bacterium]|nr:MAG: alpha/beta hydrolase [Calditrichota bacterium]